MTARPARPRPRAAAPIRATAVPGRPALTVGPWSLVFRPRHLTVVVVALAAVAAAFLAAVAYGDLTIPAAEVLRALGPDGSGRYRYIVTELRLPRAVTGLAVGAALGVSGAVMQSVARNPLASPDILGITAGSAVAAVLVLVGGGGAVGGLLAGLGLPLAALGGGLVAAATIYLLAWRRGTDGYRLVLVGIGVGAALQAVTQWLLMRADINDVATAQIWLIGSLGRATTETTAPTAITVAAVAAATLIAAIVLPLLRLGDDVAAALGVWLGPARIAVLLGAVVLAAVATAAAGPIGFVAFVAPQVAQRLVGADGPPLLASGLVGALLVLGADVVVRTVIPIDLPVGVLTAMIGGPFLLYILVRTNLRRTR